MVSSGLPCRFFVLQHTKLSYNMHMHISAALSLSTIQSALALVGQAYRISKFSFYMEIEAMFFKRQD